MRGMILFQGSIADAASVLPFRAAWSFDHADCPFSLEFDRAESRMTLDDTERLTSAGWCVEDRLARAARQRRPGGRAVF